MQTATIAPFQMLSFGVVSIRNILWKIQNTLLETDHISRSLCNTPFIEMMNVKIFLLVCYSRAAGSRKRLYLRRRYILEGRKNPMLSVVSYICVGYQKSKNKSKHAYVVAWHRYGSPLSMHTKLSIKIPCMTSQWRHEACLDSKTADFHEFPQ